MTATMHSSPTGLCYLARDGGDGPPVVLLHGIGSNAQSFAPLMEAFDPRSRMIAWDAPGYGDSHFYSGSPDECAAVLAKYPFFFYESPALFYILLPDPATGACPTGSAPVYRVWDQRADTNHRYTTSRAIRDQMVAAGWVPEGYGPDAVIMCAPT